MSRDGQEDDFLSSPPPLDGPSMQQDDSDYKPQKSLFLIDTSDEEDSTNKNGKKRKRGAGKANIAVKREVGVKREEVKDKDEDVMMLSSPEVSRVSKADKPLNSVAPSKEASGSGTRSRSNRTSQAKVSTFERGLIGTCYCSAWSLTKGKGYCSPGSRIVVERAKTKEEKEAERVTKGGNATSGAKAGKVPGGTTVIKNGKVVKKQATLSNMGVRPNPGAAATKVTKASTSGKASASTSASNPQDTIIRFRNTRGFEIGRLPSAITKHLAPLLAADLIYLSGTVVDCPTVLTVGCDIVLEVWVYLTKKAFDVHAAAEDKDSEKVTWGKEGETPVQRELRMRKDALAKLFERVSLRPVRSSALTRSQKTALKQKPGLAATKTNTTASKHPSKAGSKASSPGEVIEVADSSDEDGVKPKVVVTNGNLKSGGKAKQNGTATTSIKGKEKEVDDDESGDEAEVLDEKQLHDLESIFNRAQQTDGLLAEVEPPDTFLYTLRPYQKQALGWMTALENGDANVREHAMHPLWEEYKFKEEPIFSSTVNIDGSNSRSSDLSFYFNPYDGDLSLEFPKANSRVRGGILADSMGMGKTCMLASLLHTNREANEPLTAEKADGSAGDSDDGVPKPPKFRQLTLNKQWQPTTAPASKPAPPRRHATLVITPVSLAKQWQDELDRMSVKGSLRSVLWYGNERPDLSALLDNMEPESRTDVVITSYGTLVSEHAKWLTRQGVRSQLKSLFDIPWLRIVLDEAHTIKNRLSRAAKACYELDAQRRWALTGQSLRLSFVTVPFMAQDPKAIDVVQYILEQCLLRREKNMKDKDGKPIVDLPLKTITIETLEFSRSERKIYDAIYDRSRRKFIQLDQEGTIKNSYTSILAMLMRLRQAVDHPLLVMNKVSNGGEKSKDDILDMVGQDDEANIREMIVKFARGKDIDGGSESPIKNITDTVALASSQSTPECVICGYEVDGEVILPCYHTACRDCITTFIEKQEDSGKVPACPACGKTPLKASMLREVSNNKNAFSKPQPALKKVDFQTSTKLQALIKRLKAIEIQDPRYKALVFSQFTSMLSLIEPVLTDNGIAWLRFDGSMDQKARAAVVDEFTKPSKVPKILLISLKAGGVGLNLTMANRQNKPVFVTRFIVKDTIEKHKTALVNASLAGTENSKEGGAMADLKAIFGLNKKDESESNDEEVGEKVSYA
ncbi:hypothetical protein QFC21_005350 [Naganishia friedmannii]|uniref:Uncharacterized protein n=1 Tax=Naganishia friedmannii TaxID=89922 RepID=A0ACC2VBP5_9TREE|nr:hypothetical protein QFC21_005350 [Naganishia friedmannii]